MGFFKKLFKNDILFSEKRKNKFKLILNIESVKDSFIISYLDGKIKNKIVISEKQIKDYMFIMKTENLFYEKYKKVSPDFIINEMDTASANVDATGDTQFSGDFYAPNDARNLFGAKNKKLPIIRRPMITYTLSKSKKNKKKSGKSKKTKTKS